MDAIIIPVSNDPVTGQKRKLHFTGLQIRHDLNMVLTANVVYYDTDGVTRLASAIENDPVLTAAQKRQQINKFSDQAVKADTSGSWVDAVTGDPVDLLPDGNVPSGAVPEIQFWQNIPLSVFLAGAGLPAPVMQVMEQIKFSDLFYGAIQQGMANMDLRKRF